MKKDFRPHLADQGGRDDGVGLGRAEVAPLVLSGRSPAQNKTKFSFISFKRLIENLTSFRLCTRAQSQTLTENY
jgi:hypothetical protein